MESWMPYFVVVTTLAIVVQAILLIVLFLQLRRTAVRVGQVIGDLNLRLAPIISRVEILLEDVSARVPSIISDAAELTHLARGQVQKVDHVLTETLERLRLQIIHIDQTLSGFMEAGEEAGSRFRQTIWDPLVKATALIRGIQTGLECYRATRQGRKRAESSGE
jgi:uncharacterized membrane protein